MPALRAAPATALGCDALRPDPAAGLAARGYSARPQATAEDQAHWKL